MTKTEILAIQRPEDLFPADKDGAQSVYRKMSKFWHPDLKTGSADVFAHLTKLYRTALEKINSGRWEGPALVQLHGLDNRIYPFQTLTSYAFPYGHAIIAEEAVVYIFDADHSTEFGYMTQRIAPGAFNYASADMRQEFERYLPRIANNAALQDGRMMLQLHKTPDLVRLRDLVTHSGKLEPTHVAWIVSSLLNLACYFTYTNIVHHDISPDTYFISPEYHSGVLLGGWYASAIRGSDIATVPKRTFEVMPFNARMMKRASTRTDLELVRLTAREIIQGPVPEPMGSWLTSVGTGNAFDQYKQWQDVLRRTFGARRFVPFPTSAKTVYSATGKVV